MRTSPGENEETGAGTGAGARPWALDPRRAEPSWEPPSRALPSPVTRACVHVRVAGGGGGWGDVFGELS